MINTSGSATISRPPERAVVSVHISANGTKQKEVTAGVTQTAQKLQTDLNQLAPKDAKGAAAENAPITHWSMSSISSGSYFVYIQKDGNTEKEIQYTTSTSLQIRFADFEKLAQAVPNLANIPFTSIRSISWQLTDKTKASLVSEVRKAAVEDAFSKARDFASAAGKEHVIPVEISSDIQAQGPRPIPGGGLFGGPPTRSANALTQNNEDALKFVPEDVNMNCQVQVKFEAL
jgi:uncharacterized protein YggE